MRNPKVQDAIRQATDLGHKLGEWKKSGDSLLSNCRHFRCDKWSAVNADGTGEVRGTAVVSRCKGRKE